MSLSGYLLGGGFGWNVGEWGIACFGVEHVDVVTADGALLRASETENPDIFWAARGGGPEFFGVVVGYRLRLKKLPRAIVTSVHTYPLAEMDAVVRWMKSAMAVLPVNVEFTVTMGSAPPPLAGRATKVATGIATVFANDVAEAEATLARIAALAPADALDVQQMPTPFGVLYDIIMGFFRQGSPLRRRIVLGSRQIRRPAAWPRRCSRQGSVTADLRARRGDAIEHAGACPTRRSR